MYAEARIGFQRGCFPDGGQACRRRRGDHVVERPAQDFRAILRWLKEQLKVVKPKA